MRGVFLDRQSLDRGDLDFSMLEQVIDNCVYYDSTDSSQVVERIQDADIVISNKVMLDETALSQVSDLKLICVAATGTNNIDLEAAAQNHIQVCNVTAYGTPSVVQHVFALLLSLSRNLPAYQEAVADGAWQRSSQFCLMDFPIEELTGKVLGIVGYGELGKGVAKVAEAFGMQVKIAQRPGGPEQADRLSLDALLPQVDVLTLHCPLTAHTANLITARELGMMKNNAILINTARGGIVDEQALLDALINKKLGGAGIDVLHKEPPVQGNLLLDVKMPNLIVTPHIAWASREARQRLLNQMAENIRSFQSGSLNNRII